MVFKRKQIIENLKDDLTVAPIDTSNPDDAAVAEVENADEAITSVAHTINEM